MTNPNRQFTSRRSPIGNNDPNAGSAYGFACAIKDGTTEAIVCAQDQDGGIGIAYTVNGGVTWDIAEEPIADELYSPAQGKAIWSTLYNKYMMLIYMNDEGLVITTSTDGNIWTKIWGSNDWGPTYDSVVQQGIVEAPALGKILMYVDDRRDGSFFYPGVATVGSALSSDGGNTFTRYNNALTHVRIERVAWSESLGMFVAVALNKSAGQTTLMWRSTDGQTWTAINTTAILPTGHSVSAEDVTWHPDNGCFICCVTDFVSPYTDWVLMSTDGINWTDIRGNFFTDRSTRSIELSDGGILLLMTSTSEFLTGYGGQITYNLGASWTAIDAYPPVSSVEQMDSDPVFGEILIAGASYELDGTYNNDVIATGRGISPVSVSFDDVLFPQ